MGTHTIINRPRTSPEYRYRHLGSVSIFEGNIWMTFMSLSTNNAEMNTSITRETSSRAAKQSPEYFVIIMDYRECLSNYKEK